MTNGLPKNFQNTGTNITYHDAITENYNYVSNFYKSFSGTDTLVFILMPGCVPVVLGSISTISYSIYRTKQPVINLGRTNINGATRGVRVIAGSMIFTLINQHWLKELQDTHETAWLKNFNELKADELPLFDLMIVSANEYGSYVSMFIYGVDITDEGQVISVEDLFTENTCTFIARDIETFTAGSKNKNTSKPINYGYYVLENVKLKGWDFIKNKFLASLKKKSHKWDFSKTKFSLDESGTTIIEEPEIPLTELINNEDYVESKSYAFVKKYKKEVAERQQILTGFTRDLVYRPYNPIAGNDVAKVQHALAELDIAKWFSNIYDITTMEAVKTWQSNNNLPITGEITAKDWLLLMQEKNHPTSFITGIIINLAGCNVYQLPDLNSTIVNILSYNTTIEILNVVNPIVGGDEIFYQLQQGYIRIQDAYSAEYQNPIIDMPSITLNDTGYYVLVLQKLILSIYPTFTYNPGVYDTDTMNMIATIQNDNNIVCTPGVVNSETWLLLENLANMYISNISNNNVTVLTNNAQGEYSITAGNLDTLLMNGFNAFVSSPLPLIIKASAVAYYNNGNTKIMTNGYQLQPNVVTEIPILDFNDIFLYDLENQSIPYKVEYIIYPSNGDVYKWTINYSI